ncbi:MAG: EAL domain-containing response regulator [Rhodospirillales bacterium]
MARTAPERIETAAATSSLRGNMAGKPDGAPSRAASAAGATKSVFVLDDEESILYFLRKILDDGGLSAATFSDVSAFQAALSENRPDFVMIDLALHADDGIGVLRHLASVGYRGRVVLMSGTDERVIEAAGRFGAECGLAVAGRLQKPFDVARLKSFLMGGGLMPVPVQDGDMRKALAAGQLYHVYQPRLDLHSGRVAGGEALVRWAHPVAGELAPDQFLPRLSQQGLHDLTHGLLAQVLGQARDWENQGIKGQLSVNVPASLICEPSFYDWVKGLRQSTGARSPLTLEVTETDACVSDLDASMNIARFRLLGLSIAIDDLGVGYSSLARLRRLPICELKIDRGFVSHLADDEVNQVIVKSIALLAQGLRLKLTAEGVEDAAALEHLCALGCDFAQGYHISRALPADAFARTLRPDAQMPISSAPFPVA